MTGLLGRSAIVPALLAAVGCSACTLGSRDHFIDRHLGDLAFSTDGRWAISGGLECRAVVWEVDPEGSLERSTETEGNSGAFTPDGRWLIVAANRWTYRGSGEGVALDVWRFLEEERAFEHSTALAADGDAAFSITVSPDSQWAVADDGRGSVKIWRLAGKRSGLTSHEAVHSHRCLGRVRFSPDGRLLLTASDDETAKLWRFDPAADSGEMLEHVATLNAHRSRPDHGVIFGSIAFSPDGRWICAAYDDVIAVWPTPIEGGQVIEALRRRTHHRAVKVVQFSPDGRWLLSAGDDGTACVWSFTPQDDGSVTLTQLAERVAGGVDDIIEAAAFHPSGRWVALGTATELRVWRPFE